MSTLTEDDVRRIVREEIERSRVVPVHTTPQQPWDVGPINWPAPDFLRACPHGCPPMTICMSVACPNRMVVT